MPLDVVSNTDEKVPILVNPKRAGGKDAKIDGRPILSIVSGGATVENVDQAAADAYESETGNKGLAGYLVSEDTANTSEWKVTADADLGEGVTNIEETGTYVYSDAPAVSVGASVGTAVPK
jgi:hypothetical protein